MGTTQAAARHDLHTKLSKSEFKSEISIEKGYTTGLSSSTWKKQSVSKSSIVTAFSLLPHGAITFTREGNLYIASVELTAVLQVIQDKVDRAYYQLKNNNEATLKKLDQYFEFCTAVTKTSEFSYAERDLASNILTLLNKYDQLRVENIRNEIADGYVSILVANSSEFSKTAVVYEIGYTLFKTDATGVGIYANMKDPLPNTWTLGLGVWFDIKSNYFFSIGADSTFTDYIDYSKPAPPPGQEREKSVMQKTGVEVKIGHKWGRFLGFTIGYSSATKGGMAGLSLYL